MSLIAGVHEVLKEVVRGAVPIPLREPKHREGSKISFQYTVGRDRCNVNPEQLS
jgi:hypothetical protein